MERTFEEIIESLKNIEETVLLEILGVSSEDLVERFRDLIEQDPEHFAREVAQFDEDFE